MPTVAEILIHTALPVFFLLKNMQEDYPGVVYFDAAELDGDVLRTADSFDAIQRLVPRPTPPTDPEKQSLLLQRCGEALAYDATAHEWRVQWPELAFDTHPNHNSVRVTSCQARDRDIFGEGYTIVWVCPAEEEAVVDRLLRHVAERLYGPSDLSAAPSVEAEGPTASTRRIDVYDLLDLWSKYIDRLCFHASQLQTPSPAEGMKARRQLRQQVVMALVQRLSQLPNGPTPKDWERLDELLAS